MSFVIVLLKLNMKICKVVIVTNQYGHIPYGSVITIIERRKFIGNSYREKNMKYFIDSFIYDGKLFADWFHDDECSKYWDTNNDCLCFKVLCE